MNIVEKFLKYVSYDTTSFDETSSLEKASSDEQYKLADLLEKELKELGGEEIYINKFGSVHTYFPGNISREPIFLNAHMDTSSSASGKNIKPRIIKNYDGKDIKLTEPVRRRDKGFSGNQYLSE